MIDVRKNATAWATMIKAMGFKVYLSERGPYGFVTNAEGNRVLSFSFNDGGSLSGNYGPPSKESGTGWRMNTSPYNLKTAEDVNAALYAMPPQWVGKGWKHLTTAKEHLSQYNTSSRYAEV